MVTSMHIVRSFPGRIRLELESEQALSLLQQKLRQSFGSLSCDIHTSYSKRTRRAVLTFAPEALVTDKILEVISALSTASQGKNLSVVPQDNQKQQTTSCPPTATTHPFWDVTKKVVRFYFTRAFMPMGLRPYWTTFKVAPLLFEGLKSLSRRRLDVNVLDAAAIGSAMAMHDFATAGTIHLLLDVSETLEDWTREKSKKDISALFKGDGNPVWVLKNGKETQITQENLRQNDLVIVRSGLRIPVDGVVAEGMAMVNQSSMTGEPLSVKKDSGKKVYAGTVVEEGKIVILCEGVGGETRFAQIARAITESEQMKAKIHSQAVQLADKIVPFSFLLSGIIFIVTRNWMQAASVLMADYSCAIKLSTPLAVRSAMLESARSGALIKGGKYIEQLARIDTVVLDKTGTLTEARPQIMGIFPTKNFSRGYVLRHAACMEEHFPHPVANAVVRKAKEEHLEHEENHAEVEYILAHGIVTTLNGQRMILGSRHFIDEDEGIDLTEAEETTRYCAENGLSTLYLAVGGKLAGVIAIKDPLRTSARRFIRRLENIGVKRTIMLTGDGEAAARTVAQKLGIKEYYAKALPEDKTNLVQSLKQDKCTVAMLGDGINDSAALSMAHVGISMKHGADIAQEACDVLLTGENLESFINAVSLAKMVMRRIKYNYAFIVGSNTLLISLGAFGFISPALMAFLHNLGTVFTCASSMRPMLPE